MPSPIAAQAGACGSGWPGIIFPQKAAGLIYVTQRFEADTSARPFDKAASAAFKRSLYRFVEARYRADDLDIDVEATRDGAQ